MARKDLDDLLWETGRHDRNPDDGPFDEARLQEYREGKLSPEQVREFENMLAESAEARRQLAEAGGAPSVVDVPRRTSAIHRWRWLGAAALLAGVALLWVVGIGTDRGRGVYLDAGTFTVRVTGAAEVRGDAGVSAKVYRDTLVSVEVQAEALPEGPVEYGLYVVDGLVLRRLTTEDGLALQAGSGAVRFTVPADRLLSPEGDPFYVVVAPSGVLDLSVALSDTSAAAEVLRRRFRAAVYSKQLALIDPPSNRGETP